jgi:hypothetical protein
MLTMPFTLSVFMVRAWEAKAGKQPDEERISQMTGLLVRQQGHHRKQR